MTSSHKEVIRPKRIGKEAKCGAAKCGLRSGRGSSEGLCESENGSLFERDTRRGSYHYLVRRDRLCIEMMQEETWRLQNCAQSSLSLKICRNLVGN